MKDMSAYPKRHSLACVVLNYNDSDTTMELISKIKEYRVIDYLVIVDNYSTDNSYEALKTLNNNRIIILRSDRNGGYGYGNNVGLKYAIDILGVDYCIIANPDVLFANKTVQILKEFLQNNPQYGMVSGIQKGRYASAWKDTSVLGDLAYNSLILNKLFKPRYYPKNYFQGLKKDVYAIPGCFFLIRAKAIKEIGFYDEDFFLFEEEKVIAYKLKQLGWKSAILPSCDYIHNHSVSIKKSLKKTGEIKRKVLQSNELYLKKYRNVRGVAWFPIRLYYEMVMVESYIYSLYLKIRGKKNS